MNVSECLSKADLFTEKYDKPMMQLESGVYLSHEGYRKMVNSYNAICAKVKKLQKAYTIGPRYLTKLTVSLNEFIKLIEDVEQAEKEYEAVDKFIVTTIIKVEKV